MTADDDDTPAVTTADQIAALRSGAEAARANGNEALAVRLERSAAVLEDPDLPPTLEERIATLEAMGREAEIAHRMSLYAVVTMLEVDPAVCRRAADEVERAGAAPNVAGNPLVRQASAQAAWMLRRIAEGLDLNRLAEFASEVRH